MTKSSDESRSKDASEWFRSKELVLATVLVFIAYCAANQLWPSFEAPQRGSALQITVYLLTVYLATFAIVVAPCFLIAYLIARVPRSNHKRPLAAFLGASLIVASLVLACVVYYAHYAFVSVQRWQEASSSTVTSDAEARAASVPAPRRVTVTVTSQDAAGATEDQFDIDFLKNLEAWVVERVRANTSKAIATHGLSEESTQIRSEATYLETDGHRLAVIRIKNGDDVSMASVIGIVGDELKRVNCIEESSERVPITFGECGAKVSQVFGVSLTN